MKQVKRINESQLRAIIAESVRNVLKEENLQWTPEMLERLYGELRKNKAWAKKFDTMANQERMEKTKATQADDYNSLFFREFNGDPTREQQLRWDIENGKRLEQQYPNLIDYPLPDSFNGDMSKEMSIAFKIQKGRQAQQELNSMNRYKTHGLNSRSFGGKLNEGDFNLGEPGSFRSGSGKDFDDYSKSIGDSYKWAGSTPVEGNMDMFSVQNGHDTDAMHFQSKKETIDWIKSHISNEEQAQNLISALKDYIRVGGGKRIRQRGI